MIMGYGYACGSRHTMGRPSRDEMSDVCVKEFSVRVERLEANFYCVHTGYTVAVPGLALSILDWTLGGWIYRR